MISRSKSALAPNLLDSVNSNVLVTMVPLGWFKKCQTNADRLSKTNQTKEDKKF